MKVLSVGAVLWDIIEGKEHIGGAPFNLCAHLLRLGADTAFLTRIGRDGRAEKTLEIMSEIGLNTNFVQTDEKHMTGIAEVFLDENRNANYNIPYAAYDEIRADGKTISEINSFNPDVICFGTLEQRYKVTRPAIQNLLARTKPKDVFYDVNIRMGFIDKNVIEYGLRHTTILKLNEDESKILSGLFFDTGLNLEDFCGNMIEEFQLKTVIVTLAEKGCYAYYGGKGKYINTQSFGLGDTVGAGDAFSAAFIYAYLSGKQVFEAAECGNLLGAYVAGKIGAFPEYDDMIKQKLSKYIKLK